MIDKTAGVGEFDRISAQALARSKLYLHQIPIHTRQFEDWPWRSAGAYRPRFWLVLRRFRASGRANETYEYASAERNASAREPRNRAWDRAWKRTARRTGDKRLERDVAYRIDRYVWVHRR